VGFGQKIGLMDMYLLVYFSSHDLVKLVVFFCGNDKD